MYSKGKNAWELESYTVNNQAQTVLIQLIESTVVATRPVLVKKLVTIQNDSNPTIVDKSQVPEGFKESDASTWGSLKVVPRIPDPEKQYWDFFLKVEDYDAKETVTVKMDQAIFATLAKMGEIPMGGKYE